MLLDEYVPRFRSNDMDIRSLHLDDFDLWLNEELEERFDYDRL